MKRNWFVAALVIGIVAIVIAAVAMRLSDDGPQATSEWADSVCSSLVDWRDSISSLTLQNANVAEESQAELQQAFADAPSCQSLQADS